MQRVKTSSLFVLSTAALLALWGSLATGQGVPGTAPAGNVSAPATVRGTVGGVTLPGPATVSGAGPASLLPPPTFRNPHTLEQLPVYRARVSEEQSKLAQQASQLERTVQQLVHDFAGLEDEEAKAKLKVQLAEALVQQFDARHAIREQELQQLEEQMKRLRELLEKRKEAKPKIIESRMDELIRAAEGLGWDGNIGTGMTPGIQFTPVNAYQPAYDPAAAQPGFRATPAK